MAAPAAMRANYSHLFGASMLPVLEEIFQYEMEMHPSRREELFKVVSTDRDIWQATELHDLGLFEELAEGASYSFQRPKQGASRTLSIAKFGLGFSVSKEMVADAKFDVIADMTRKLAKSAKESQEIKAMAVFNNGFTSELANDGLAVFHAAHTLPSGGTYRNRLAVNADLSNTALDQALVDFATQFVGDGGIIYNPRPKILLVAPQNWRYAKELIGSELKADSADNNMNSFREDGLRVIQSPHLTDPDAWFLLEDPSEHGLRIVSREGIKTEADMINGFATDSILYKASYREQIGVTTAKGVFGSPGA